VGGELARSPVSVLRPRIAEELARAAILPSAEPRSHAANSTPSVVARSVTPRDGVRDLASTRTASDRPPLVRQRFRGDHPSRRARPRRRRRQGADAWQTHVLNAYALLRRSRRGHGAPAGAGCEGPHVHKTMVISFDLERRIPSPVRHWISSARSIGTKNGATPPVVVDPRI
jgi:hypothetical protein